MRAPEAEMSSLGQTVQPTGHSVREKNIEIQNLLGQKKMPEL